MRIIKKLKRILNLLTFKLIRESELLSTRICLVNVILKIGQEKYLLSIMCRKLNLGQKKQGFKRRKKMVVE